MIQSPLAATLRSCSTTITVLPASTRPWSCARSRRTSAGCNPVVGSSSTYNVSPRPARCNSVASLMRCASPPESSVAVGPSAGSPDRPAAKNPARGAPPAPPRKTPTRRPPSTRALPRRSCPGTRSASFRVVARPAAHGARRVDARQEKQFDAHETLALAIPATAFRHVERKPARVVAPGARRLCFRKNPAHAVEKPRVRRQIRARGASDGLLVHHDQPPDFFGAANDPAAGRRVRGAFQRLLVLIRFRRNLLPSASAPVPPAPG